MRRPLWIVAALLLPAVPAGALGGWFEAFVYDRFALARGEVWRLLTGHWVHYSAGHLLADAAALLLGAGLVNERQTRAWLFTLSLAAGLIPVALWIGSPELARYGGLSGLALATWTFAAAGLMRSSRRLGVSVFCLVAAKVLAESLTGQFGLADLPDGEVVPATLAHGVGALVGIAGALWAGSGEKEGARTAAARFRRGCPG